MFNNTSVAFLIRWAYDLDQDQLIGSTRELESIPYDIVAKMPDPASNQGKAMMQALLAERFHLQVHRETRELSSYALVLDSRGAKLKYVDAATPPDPDPFKMTERGRLFGTRVNGNMLAKVLASELSRPVKDETGVDRFFDFVLEWTPDLDSAEEVQGTRPSIFTALREQMGLRLESRKSPVQVIVIDGVHPEPSDN